MRHRYWRVVPFLLFFIIAIFLWRGLSLDPQELPSVQLGKTLPSFELPVLGHHNNTLSANQIHGQVVLLNVWASWCEACSEEQVFLLHLAQQGVLIYGINYKDSEPDALKWLQEWGNPYRLIGSDLSGRVAIDLGVYGAPETFLIDKQGIIRYRHAGILTERVWQDVFVPMINRLDRA